MIGKITLCIPLHSAQNIQMKENVTLETMLVCVSKYTQLKRKFNYY